MSKTIAEIKIRNSINHYLTFSISLFIATLILVIFSQIKIPTNIYHIPFTGQSFAILIVGFFFGLRLSLFALAITFIISYFYHPIFNVSAYSNKVINPHSGYIIGFILAIIFVAYLSDQGYAKKALHILLISVIAHLIIHLAGSFIFFILGSAEQIEAFTITPYLIGDSLKILLATFLVFYLNN